MNEEDYTLFICGATFMFFLCAGYIILYVKKASRMRDVIGYLSLYFSLWTLKDLFVCFNPDESEYYKNLITYLDGWSAVAYGVYIIELSTPGWISMKKIILALIPFVAFTGIHIVHPSSLMLDIYIVFLIIAGLSIAIVATIRTVKYLKYIRSTYSSLEDIDISWLKFIFVWLVMLQILWVLDAIKPTYLLDSFYYICFALGWFRIIWYSRNLKAITIEEESEEEKNEIEKSERENGYEFAGKLENIIIEQELYKKADLSLYDLTILVNTNRTYISDYFCHVLNTTFYDYINCLRIEKSVIPLLKNEEKNLTIDAIAYMSGFNSISTFRRAFIKNTGMTPSRYRRQLVV